MNIVKKDQKNIGVELEGRRSEASDGEIKEGEWDHEQ